jgi:hypothetical protein
MPKQRTSTAHHSARIINAVLLLGFAVAILVAISPFSAGVDPNYRGINLYSYFTVQSNLIAMTTFVIGASALFANRRLGQWFGMLRGGAVLYMLITMVVYALLLKNVTNANSALAFDWKNFILHEAAPLFIVVEWLLWPSRQSISWRQAFWWLAFPVAWLLYTFVRASVTGWYPYPFLDPVHAGGHLGVAAHVVGIAVGFILFSQAVAWVSRVRKWGVADSSN